VLSEECGASSDDVNDTCLLCWSGVDILVCRSALGGAALADRVDDLICVLETSVLDSCVG
jgi:hypothetical protein